MELKCDWVPAGSVRTFLIGYFHRNSEAANENSLLVEESLCSSRCNG